MKEALKARFPDIEWIDLGTDSAESVDYPDFGHAMGKAIESGEAEKGILVCGTGIGISIAANRNPAVRAGVCANTTMARLTRFDNDANVLALGARIIGIENAVDCVKVFLETPFAGDEDGGERHARRVKKL